MNIDLMSFIRNHNIGNLQHIFLYYYVPKRYTDDVRYPSFTQETIEFQHNVWKFKDGMQQNWALDAIENVLGSLGYIGQANGKLVLACIPASTKYANILRYRDFSQELCKRLNIQNSFDHIEIIKEKEPKHLSGCDTEAILSFDRNFFAGKDVVIFDDIVTKGRSMFRFAQQLHEIQAHPVICCSLGYTYFPEKTTVNPINPYTARHVLQQNEVSRQIESTVVVPFYIKSYNQNISTSNNTVHTTNSITHNIDPSTNNAEEDLPKFEHNATCASIENNIKPSSISKQSSISKTEIVKQSNPTITTHQKQNQFSKFSKITFGSFCNKPLIWEVLSYDPSNESALVISKYGITCRPYHQHDELTSWEECSLRKWMNGLFFDKSFNTSEKNRIITSHVPAEVVVGHELYPGNDTNDKIYILSINEYQSYYQHISQWRCFLLEAPRIKRQCWLRNYGADRGRAAFIGRSGRIHEGGSLITSARNTIRPVMLIKV